MKLYVAAASGNSYKVKILLSLLNVTCESVVLDISRDAMEHRLPAHLERNPRGEVPVLEDDGLLLWDSSACLVYIARRHGDGRWLPDDPATLAQVTQWLALSASEIQFGLQYGRRGVRTGRWTAGDETACQTLAGIALRTMEGRLAGHDWLAASHPTIADVACFPYAETAAEGNASLEPYPAVRAWLDRCRDLPGWPAR